MAAQAVVGLLAPLLASEQLVRQDKVTTEGFQLLIAAAVVVELVQ
jgi:hypothetical protein